MKENTKVELLYRPSPPVLHSINRALKKAGLPATPQNQSRLFIEIIEGRAVTAHKLQIASQKLSLRGLRL